MLQWQSPPSDPRLSSIQECFIHSLEIANKNQPRINRFHNSHGRKQEKDHASNISQSFPEAEIVNLGIAIVSSMFLENQVSFCIWFWKEVTKTKWMSSSGICHSSYHFMSLVLGGILQKGFIESDRFGVN